MGKKSEIKILREDTEARIKKLEAELKAERGFHSRLMDRKIATYSQRKVKKGEGGE